MGRKSRGLILVTGVAAVVSAAKAVKEFINYKKLENKDVYINAELKSIEDLQPVIRKSICTGEMEAGFKDKSGNFTSYMLIKNDKDLEQFKERYGISGDVKVEY